MRRRFGRVLALVLAMSLILANASAASATDSQAGVTDLVVQESTSEDVQIEEKEVIPEDVETEETTGDSQLVENKEESEPKAEEQPAVTEETVPEDVKELRFENEDVTVVVSEKEVGAISEGTSLKVVPITANDDATKAQYQEVEKQIQEKAGKEEKEVAGFLAYDITLVDVQGNEVEPNSSVKVSMEYKKETIPEGLSEEKAKEADVTVYHLEEDENGKVREIVDMTSVEEAQTKIKTTETTKIQSAEFLTTSFSVYTIVWKDVEIGWGNNPTAKLYFYDVNGNDISRELGVYDERIEIDGNGNLGNKGKSLDIIGRQYSKNGYYFYEACLDSYNSDLIANDISYNAGASNDYKWHYCLNGSWRGWKESDRNRNVNVYLIYTKEKPSELSQVATVYAKDKGVKMKMIDLAGDGRNLKNGETTVDFGAESGYGNGTIKSGLLNSRIRNGDGFPTVKKDNDSLKRLFVGAKEVDYLFREDIYNESGYFEYSSFENYAYLGNQSRFTVYNQIGTPSDEAEYFYQRGNFMPYNKIENYKFSGNKNWYDENGKKLTDKSPRYKEKLYKTQGNNNFQFGMMLEAEFTQQRDGMATHTKPNGDRVESPMVYEFNGDDDLWVFIDDVLVLDIGGVHDAHSGSIDFSTGDVVWYDCESEKTPIRQSTTLKQIFRNAGVLPSGKVWSLTGAGKEFEGNTFADYTTEHSFKMYYFERGAGASNLHVKFNLPTVPDDSINIQKVVQTEAGQDVNYVKDVDFLFQIEVDKQLYANQPYDIVVGNNIIGHGTTDEKAQFTLKHGQTARFNDLSETTNYRVKELGAYLDGYEVVLNGTTIWKPDEGSVEHVADSKDLNVGENSVVVFINRVRDTAVLEITKKLAGETGATNKEFQIELKLGDELYSGSYTVGNTTTTISNGIIKLKAGQTARIIGLPYGIKFELRELMDGSYLPTYGITGENVEGVQLPEINEDGTSNGIYSASAQMNGDCQVTVTNKKIEMGTGVTHVKVTKEWENLGAYELPPYVVVTLYKDVNSNGEWDESDTLVEGYDPQQLTKDNAWTAEWKNLSADTNYVVKESYPPGYELIETSIDNDFSDIVKVGDRNTPNANTKFNIGKNNILLVKETGNHYFLWTPVDLKLDREDIAEVVTRLNTLGLEGAGNLDSNNVSYKYGEAGQSGIHLTPNENGWTLGFEKKSDWAMFWSFSYTRTQHITLKNNLKPDATASVWVHKDWLGDTKDTRPESIKIQLYQNGRAFGNLVEMTADSSGKWNYRFDNLPIFAPINNGKYEKYVYTIGELWIGDEKVIDNTALGYKVTIAPENGVVASGDEELSKITITNTKGKPWEIYKVSSSKTEGEKLYLKDAWFELKSDSDTFYGKTDENGLLKWYTEKEHVTEAKLTEMNGQFVLSETKAPAGYQKSTETWTIKLNYGNVESVVSSNGNVIEPEEVEDTYRFYYEDTPLYSLPESGGNGIYWYMVGGVLLLTAAGMLILYKSRRKEVLES